MAPDFLRHRSSYSFTVATAHEQGDDSRDENEALRKWACQQRRADALHSAWDDEDLEQFKTLVAHCEAASIIERGSLDIRHPTVVGVRYNGDL